MSLLQKIGHLLFPAQSAEKNAPLSLETPIHNLIWPRFDQAHDQMERLLVLQGQTLHEQNRLKTVRSLQDVEFRVFSQFGDDGIILYLVEQLKIPASLHRFVEFGVQDYRESNTRFLLLVQNWSGLVLDGSEENIKFIRSDGISWRQELAASHCWVTRENINRTLEENGFGGEIGLLHVDLDGNDYWIWKEITVISPWIVIMEYNAVFGGERAVTVPYDPKFDRTQAHPCGQYWGVSLQGVVQLAEEKGYEWVGCNRAGNNAYFVRKDKMQPLQHLLETRRFIASKFRDSRDEAGNLNFLTGTDRLKAIGEKEVWDIPAGRTVSCRELIS